MTRLLIWLFAFAPSLTYAFSLNDITVLLPLPTAHEMPELLQPGNIGDKGPFLPKEVFLKLPRLLDDEPAPKIYNEMLRLIAVRLDPCFVEGKTPMACKKQIRLVWQPLYDPDEDGDIATRDAAVHTFYEFNDAEWREVVKEWQKLSTTDSLEPVQVHPVLSDEGFTGPYWKTLKALLLKYCGSQNLTRATAMNVMNGEQVWAFAGLDVNGTVISPIQIPRIGRNVQGIIMGTSNTDEFTGSMRPAPQEDPVLEALMMDSQGMKQNEKELKELMQRIYAFENPKLNNPGTLDCVSCHVAQSAREWAQRSFNHWDWQNDFKPFAYTSAKNTENVTEGFKTNHFRALGYFHRNPLISQRVINETAETAATFKRSR